MKYSNFLKRDLTKHQGTKQWKKIRKTMITATDVSNAKINGNFLLNKFKEKEPNEAMRLGNLLEPISRDIFSNIMNVNVRECGLIKHKEYSIGASPDGYFYCKDNRGIEIKNIPQYLLEIKNLYKRTMSHLIPYHYWVQMQIQMFVTDTICTYYFETEIKFKQVLTSEDEEKYEYYGECDSELLEFGKYWYLNRYFLTKCERDNNWLNNNIDFLLDMCNKLKTYQHSSSKYNLRSSHKRKFSDIIKSDLPSVSDYYYNENSMHPYINNDTLSDWLDMYAKHKYPDIKPETDDFLKSVSNYNKICASNLRNNLIMNYSNIIYKVATIPLKNISPYNVPLDLHEMTLYYMKKDYDIILNPLLIDTTNKMYVNMFALIKGKVLCQETNLCDGINQNAYYPYIFKKKRFKVYRDNQDKLTNDHPMKEIRCSAIFHYEMLNKFQKEQIDRVFLLGWGYEINKQKVDFNLQNELLKNRIQCVKIADEKELIEKCKGAFKWLNLCKKLGHQWDPLSNLNDVPLKYRRYLYPNVCNKNRWHKIKKELAQQWDDVGLFWNIGPQKRQELQLKYGVNSWKERKFISYIDDKFKKNALMMKDMVRMSKDKNAPAIYLPNKKIKNLHNNWNIRNRLEFYVDFETINTSTSDIEIIYLIGMSIKFPDGSIDYFSYMIPELKTENEIDIIKIWIKDMDNLRKKYHCKYIPNVFCWGNAEKQMLNAAMERMKLFNTSVVINFEFIDMCKMFKTEPILIKGAKEGFSLKTILPKMIEHKLIDEIKYDDFCDRGDISIVHALDYYNRRDDKIKKDLIRYNEIDCIALSRIVNKVREYC